MFSFDGVKYGEGFMMPPDIYRQRSKSEGLVRKTLGFARAYSDVELDRTEQILEAEIRRESIVPPRHKKLARVRLKGERLLHSKHVLLGIVILNLIDCALVLGELILDIHFIRELRNKSDASAQLFIDTLQTRYPDHLHGHNIEHLDSLYAQLYLAQCQWTNDSAYVHDSVEGPNGRVDDTLAQNPVRIRGLAKPANLKGSMVGPSYTVEGPSRNLTYSGDKYVGAKKHVDRNDNPQNIHIDDSSHISHAEDNGQLLHNGYSNHSGHSHGDRHHEHSVWEHVAHGMHKASITILGILFVENLLKLMCMGRTFLIKRLEVFDALIVFISFVVDLVLLKGLMEFKVQDAVFILTFLLPWRVIRVVNSLIVAVLDHEHFRLKMLYQEKKAVCAELKLLKAKEKGWDFHLKKIEHFCESEGIPKWKIRQHTAMGRKQSTITSMASLALNGILKGMVLSPSDKLLLEKSLSLSTQDSTSLGIISESDDFTEVSRQTSQSSATDETLFYVTSDESEKNDDWSLMDRESSVRQEVQADVEHARAQPENSIMKIASKATIKSVTFEPKEMKPLLHRQDSFEINDNTGNNDDGNSEE